MEKNMQFETRPEVQPWGNDKMNVPLNAVTRYQADILCKVKKPVTQDSIVEAAVSEKYTEAERLRIMSNFTKENDPEVEAFKAFTAEIREAAKAEGYE